MEKRSLIVVAVLLFMAGCAEIVLKPVDYSWSYESVLTTDANGFAKGEPKTISFNVKDLVVAETGNPSAPLGDRTIRIIRDWEGYYYVASPGFRHVYIFSGDRGELSLEKKVMVIEGGMDKPFLNRREKGIELVTNNQTLLLNRKGIVPPEVKK